MNSRLQELNRNIEAEARMARELAGFVEMAENSGSGEKVMFMQVINSLRRRIILLNNSIPELLNQTSLANKLPGQKPKTPDVEEVQIDEGKSRVVVHKKDKKDFLRELNISEEVIRKLKKRKPEEEEESIVFKKPSFYGKLANKVFLKISEEWVRKGNFKILSLNLKRSNLNILTTTYLSMMFFSIILSVFAGILILGFLIMFGISFEWPFISIHSGGYLSRFFKLFWIIFLVPILTGVSFYFFPGMEKNSLAKRIDQELPFVVIHMASISGSGIEPSEIFKIIGLSKEYKNTKKEIRKILNQINIYGYNLTNALRNVALATPSPKLAELLNGIGVTINSGGDINSFFEKRAESLLLDYRLEREKFTKNAETFMDIYISIVIAAPMILLMLLIMISVSGIQTGFGVTEMTLGIIGIVAIINLIFLTFLHLKQPTY